MALISLENTITFALSAKDRHASAAWYGDMLGFALLYHADEAGWTELATMTEGVTLGLGEMGEPAPGNALPVFGVADIAAARTALEGADVRFDGPTETIPDMVSTATFYDLDGNALMLAQDLTPAA